MLRYFCLTLLTCLNLSLFAQSYIGFGADNFNGVHGIITNPANIADSRSRIDINLASVSMFTTNSYLELEYFNLISKDTGDFEAQSNRLGLDKINSGVFNSDILGPSVMVSLSEKHSIAFSTRARSFLNINNLDGEVIKFFFSGSPDDLDRVFVSDINGSAVANNWIEYGATYARVLNDNKIHFFKGGATLKYITGYGALQATTSDALLFYDETTNPDEALLLGEADYTYSKNIDSNEDFIPFGSGDEYEFKSDARGLALDLGIVYEYRPRHRQNISRDNVKEQVVIRHKSTYKYKIGLSIMDIGRLNYKQSLVSSGNLNAIDVNTLFGGDFENDIKPAFGGAVNERTDQSYWLPANVRAEFDLKLKNKFYLNATSRLSIFSKENETANRYANQVTVSPRYETKWITAFSPITYTQFGGMQWGLGGRLGPLFIGSSSAISHLIIDKQTRTFDFYAGIKIPIFHKTPPPPPEDNPAGGFKSNCNGCIQKDEKQPTKRLKSYSEARR